MENRTSGETEKPMAKSLDFKKFIITIEVVPPGGDDPEPLLRSLVSLENLPVDGFSVATNPVPEPLRKRMHSTSDPVAQGVLNAREMVAVAREFFQGACVMPPFEHYEILPDILAGEIPLPG